MKKIKGLIALLVLSLMLSGCVKAEYNLIVTKEDVSFKGSVAISKEALAQMQEMAEQLEEEQGEEQEEDEEDISSYAEEYEDNGFTTEEFEDDEYQGVRFEKSFGTLDELSTTEEIEDEVDLESGEVDKLFVKDESDPTKTKYTAKLKVSRPTDEIAVGGEEEEIILRAETSGDDNNEADADLSELAEAMDMKYKVSLPVAPLSHNATSVEGNVLTWDLTTFEEEYIEFSFELPNEEVATANEGETNIALRIISGANQTYYRGSNETITIKVNGDPTKLRGVEIDNGNPLRPEDYTVNTEGEETVLTFSASFLEGSSIGEHTITFKYDDDEEIETKLTFADAVATSENTTEVEPTAEVEKAETVDVPKTGDNIVLYIITAFVSLIVLSGAIVCLKKVNI